MLRAAWVGARAAAQRWPLVVGLWLATAAFGAAFAVAAGAWLAEALGGSLATRTLANRIDLDVLVDLWVHHREGLRMLAVLAAVLAGGHTVLWWWLHGVLVAALQRPAGDRGAWGQGASLAPVMAQLWAIALLMLGLFSGAIGAAAYALLHWTRADPSPMIWYRIGAGAAASWVAGAVFLTAVHDHARLRAGRAEIGALPAYRWALAFVLRGGERAFPLACLLQSCALALWIAYQTVGFATPVVAALGLTGSLLWAEAYLVARAWVRVWFFAAENELQP